MRERCSGKWSGYEKLKGTLANVSACNAVTCAQRSCQLHFAKGGREKNMAIHGVHVVVRECVGVQCGRVRGSAQVCTCTWKCVSVRAGALVCVGMPGNALECGAMELRGTAQVCLDVTGFACSGAVVLVVVVIFFDNQSCLLVWREAPRSPPIRPVGCLRLDRTSAWKAKGVSHCRHCAQSAWKAKGASHCRHCARSHCT